MVDPGPGIQGYSGGMSLPASSTEQLLAAAGMAGQIIPGQGSDPLVYMGEPYWSWDTDATKRKGVTVHAPSANYAAKQAAFFTLDQAQSQFYGFTQSEMERLKEVAARYTNNPDVGQNLNTLQSVWNTGISAAVAQSTITNKPVTPWEALERLAGQVTPAPDDQSGQYTGPQTTLDLTNPDTANYILGQALQQEIGRAPNEEEKQQFRQALRMHERANPTVRTYMNEDQPGEGYTTQGGTNATAFASEWAKSQEGAAEYRSTRYADLLLQAIDNPDL